MFELAPDSPAPKTRRSYTRKPKSTLQPQETPDGLQDQARQVTPPPTPVEPEIVRAEVAQVTTRYGHPVYVASQRKTVYPGEVCPIIVDGWVKHHLGNPRGALVRA